MQATDVPEIARSLTETSPKGFVAAPVCRRCHEFPDRRLHPIKATFFPREHARVAALLAGSDTIQG